MDDAATTLGSAKADIEGGTLALKGDFAPKIRDAIGDLPGELRKLARGYAGCGRALDTFAAKLSEAQVKSRQTVVTSGVFSDMSLPKPATVLPRAVRHGS